MKALRIDFADVTSIEACFDELEGNIRRLRIDEARKMNLLGRLGTLRQEAENQGFIMPPLVVAQFANLATDITGYTLEVEGLAGSDPLTEIANMRSFRDEARRTQARMVRGLVGSAAVLFIDALDFGKINKIHGDPVGDQAIRKIAEILNQCTRETDMVARLHDADEAFERVRDTDAVARKGGDEYPVLVASEDPDCNFESVRTRIYEAFADAYIEHDGEKIHLNVSVGLTPFTTQDTIEGALKRADDDMRTQKRAQYARLEARRAAQDAGQSPPEVS